MTSSVCASVSEFLPVRNLRYHIRRWGRADAPALFLLHGWMDASASFQFLAEHLADEWQLIAPDWRGFGLTQSPADVFWFADYLADLDAILDHYSPAQPVMLCGHSLGGNVAMMYAGIRPERVARLINLEGFGLPTTVPEEAPQRYRQWLDQLRRPPAPAPYPDLATLVRRLRQGNPLLSSEKAEFLARHLAKKEEDGWQLLANPGHRVVSPLLYQVEEVLACWEKIAAPVLWMEAEHSHHARWPGDSDMNRSELERRINHVMELRRLVIAGAGHMLHQDQPQAVAQAMDAFLGD